MQGNTVEEMFCDMPHLLVFFQECERELVRAKMGIHKKGITAERVKARNGALLETVKSLTANELKLIYYLRMTDGISAEKMLKELRKVFHAQCGFKNILHGTDIYKDILQMTENKC